MGGVTHTLSTHIREVVMSQGSDFLKLVRLYENKTGYLEPTKDAVAQWAAKREAIEMPVPPTPEELLAEKIGRAMASERRRSSSSVNGYRGNLSYKTLRNGQIEYRWFDIDGPAATAENMAQAQGLRRDKAVGILAQAKIDNQHWRDMNPTQPLPAIDCDLTDEVAWRINAEADDGDAEERRTG